MDVFGYFDICVNMCIVLVSAFGNSLVMISIWKYEWLKSSTNYFVALLALCDFCNGLPVFVAGTVASTFDKTMENVTLNYVISCKTYITFVSFSGLGGDLLCILIITVDRYFCINQPLRYHSIVTRNKALILSTIFLVGVSIFSLSGVTRTKVGRPCISIRSANGNVFRFYFVTLGKEGQHIIMIQSIAIWIWQV